jgi:hypothetical protein
MFGLKKIFGRRKEKNSVENFWDWFKKNEHQFRKVMSDSEKAQIFLSELIEQIKPFNPWLKALAGPYDDKRYELIITADGDIALFCKVEELVQAAPTINGWILTAHKPGIGLEKMRVDMGDREYSSDNMKFYPVQEADYPDEIKIVLTHPDYNEEEKENFQQGGIIYLENALGELNTATLIDSCEVKGIPGPDIELIPLGKLEDYLKWREKEFIEKYEKLEAERPEDIFNVLEAQDSNGLPVLATINTGYAEWKFKAAYPWCVQVDIDYKGEENGMPDKKQLEELQEIEDQLLKELEETHLIYLGHDTHNNRRTIYAYGHEYNIVSKKIHQYLENANWDYPIVFFIRKDKYWRNMEWFFNASEKEEGE